VIGTSNVDSGKNRAEMGNGGTLLLVEYSGYSDFFIWIFVTRYSSSSIIY
jgi:hypothetical protein